MNRRIQIVVGLIAVLAIAVSVIPTPRAQALSVAQPGQGQLIGVCWDGAVYLFWGSHPQANSNGLQKGDLYPNDPNNFWGWVVQGNISDSYIDYSVTPGVQYTYRVKYRPELPSNEVRVTCPVTSTNPPAYPSLECRPGNQYADSGEWVIFTAHRSQSSQYPNYSLTWRAVGGYPSSGTGTSFDTRFYTDSINETRRVTVSDGFRTATCTVRVDGEYRRDDLRLTPTNLTVDDGELVTFRATGGTGQYRWAARDTVPYEESGSYWSLRFDNPTSGTRTHTVEVRSGNQTRTATVRVRPRTLYTPTPTPYGSLQCYPSTVSAVSGEEVVLRAWGGNGHYTWSNTGAQPVTAYGAVYATRFTNNTGSVRSYSVTVASGWERATCRINVASIAVPVYPRVTPPAWTPVPYPTEDLRLSQGARNVSAGNIALTSSVTAKGNDTVQFSLEVRNTSSGTLENVRLTDILPSGLQYVWSSTTRDGRVIEDGVTTSGINLGILHAGSTATIRFSAVVDSIAVPDRGSRTLYNTAQVRADGAGTEISRLAVVLSSTGVLGAASIAQTGTADTVLIALAAALAVTGLYALYAGSAHFERRHALAGIRKQRRDKNRLNFARLL